MKKPKSMPLMDDRDFPINMVRRHMLEGTGSEGSQRKTAYSHCKLTDRS